MRTAARLDRHRSGSVQRPYVIAATDELQLRTGVEPALLLRDAEAGVLRAPDDTLRGRPERAHEGIRGATRSSRQGMEPIRGGLPLPWLAVVLGIESAARHGGFYDPHRVSESFGCPLA
jgi:hypothetical protein